MSNLSTADPKCWICGGVATTREHFIKAADVRLVQGVKRGGVRLRHIRTGRERKIQGAKSDYLKYQSSICAQCNNQHTQPHDVAYDGLISYINRNAPTILAEGRINLRTAFGLGRKERDRRQQNLVLYFVKRLGCAIMDATGHANAVLAEAIMRNTPPRDFTLAFWIDEVLLQHTKQLDRWAIHGDLHAFTVTTPTDPSTGWATQYGQGWLHVGVWFNCHSPNAHPHVWTGTKPDILLERLS